MVVRAPASVRSTATRVAPKESKAKAKLLGRKKGGAAASDAGAAASSGTARSLVCKPAKVGDVQKCDSCACSSTKKDGQVTRRNPYVHF